MGVKKNEEMIETIQKTREYLNYLERHYNNVQAAWALINEKCPNNEFRFISDDFVWHTINNDVINHDLSKFSAEEFTQYRLRFFPTEEESRARYKEKNAKVFNKAWNHHKNNNEHHWQNWTKKKPTPYDDAFVVMMVVDWVAMGMEEGNEDAQKYYERIGSSTDIPEWADDLINKVFECIYPK